jgi:hypothetical protein
MLGTSKYKRKFGKNGLEVRKLEPPQVMGSFLQKILDRPTQSLFLNPFKKSLNIPLLSLELQDDL